MAFVACFNAAFTFRVGLIKSKFLTVCVRLDCCGNEFSVLGIRATKGTCKKNIEKAFGIS